MYKVYIICIISLITILLFLNNCGIEDDVIYFQEPRNLSVTYNAGGDEVEIKFYGFNQEKDDNGAYLFVGYDIYYYISDSSSAKKAAVKDPLQSLTHTTQLISYTQGSRFPASDFSTTVMDEFYQYVSIPVTDTETSVNMIEDILYEGNNDNVRIKFHDDDRNNNNSALRNPYAETVEDYILMDEIYPNYEEYRYQEWADESSDNFLGFYDIDYWDSLGVPGNDVGGGYFEYEMYFYIIAKGFNSDIERTRNFVESIKSSTIKITFKVSDSTDNP